MGGDAMAATKPQHAPVQLNLRVSPEMAEALDQWVREINEARTWPRVTRTDVLRELLERGLRERPDIG